MDQNAGYENGAGMNISAQVSTLLQLPSSTSVTVSFGNRSAKTNIHVVRRDNSIIRMSSTLATELAFPNGQQIHMRYDRNKNTLVLGPLLGILVSSQHTGQEMRYGKITPFCREVIRAARMKGVCAFAFTINDLQPGLQTVRGSVFKNGSWSTHHFPLPDVIYNRLSSRTQERSGAMRQLFARLKERDCIIFNEQFLDKWQVYQAFDHYEGKNVRLPKTLLYKGLPTLKTLLQQYPVVYVKPTDGSLGRGIYRVRNNGKRFVCTQSTMNGPLSRSYSSLPLLHQGLHPRISGRPYLVQEGLNLLKQQGNPIDFRVLVQKNQEGKWGITSIVARTGSNTNIVSNVARGGKIRSASAVLRQAQITGSRPNVQALRSAALQIANGLDSVIPGQYGELGIDLAVDYNGRIWLLEINSKPSKSDDTLYPGHQGTRPSVVRMIDYALHLGGFTKHTGISHARRRRNKNLNAAG